MKSAMNKVFWGFIITFFNINIGVIQILPDFIGYIVVAIGLVELGTTVELSIAKEFNIAKNLAWAMVIITVISLFLANPNLNYEGQQVVGVGVTIWGAISTVILYSLYYFILRGINAVAGVSQCGDLEYKSETFGNIMLVIGMVYLCFSSFTLNFSQRGIIMAIAPMLMIVVFGAFIYFLYFIRKVYNRFE